MNRHRRPRGVRIFFIAIAGIAAIFLFTYLVMLLWNAIIPDIFNAGTITYWQALGLLVLSKIFFGFGGGGGGKRRWRRHVPQEHWASMTPEEKEKFRNEWRNRCGWQEYPAQAQQQQQQQPPAPGTQSA